MSSASHFASNLFDFSSQYFSVNPFSKTKSILDRTSMVVDSTLSAEYWKELSRDSHRYDLVFGE